MQHKKSSIGPRGWAILTLVGGAALASLFLRPPQVELPGSVSDTPLGYPSPPGRLASAQLGREHLVPKSIEVRTLDEVSADGPAGNPMAKPQFPAWATPPSPLDQLISQGSAPPWRYESQPQQLQPPGTWQDSLETARGMPSTQSGHSLRGDSLPTEVGPVLPPPWPAPQPWPAASTSPQPLAPATAMSNQPDGTLADAARSVGSLTA